MDLTTPAHATLGKVAEAPFVHPLSVGLSGTLRGVPCQIAGHVRYAQPDWHWDEYLLVANDGQTAWLEYDEGFTLYRPFVPRTFEPITASSGYLVADGVSSRITEREHARIAYIGGELPFVPRAGDMIEYIDAHAISVEISETELEWFRVSSIAREEVAAAFSLSPQALAAKCYRLDDEGRVVSGGHLGQTAKAGVVIIGILMLMIGMCFFTVCLGLCTGSSTGSSGRRTYGSGGGGHGSYGGYSGGK